jgi:hypothetical protein
MISFIRRRKSQESSMNTAYKRNGVMQHSLPNGKNQDLKDCVVSNVYKREIHSLEKDAYAESLKIIWKRKKRLSA